VAIRKVWALIITSSICWMTGCTAVQAVRDQDVIRARLLDLYTSQIMDNLVRARNGLPAPRDKRS